MAFAATDLTTEPRAFAVGPIKFQLMTYTAVSGDTSGTITADKLSDRINHIIIDGGLTLTAAPTYTNGAPPTATLAFANPGANAYGNILVVGV